nr:M23 family peptidase [Xanthomonadales bacterium]NIX13863.1 M23 family peptidase [Xanthomonadales bacterium]
MRQFLVPLFALLQATALHALELDGAAIQGGLIFGVANPGSDITLDGEAVQVSPAGRFVIGFGRDETGTRLLEVAGPGTERQVYSLEVAPREYDIERVDGLPPRTV